MKSKRKLDSTLNKIQQIGTLLASLPEEDITDIEQAVDTIQTRRRLSDGMDKYIQDRFGDRIPIPEEEIEGYKLAMGLGEKGHDTVVSPGRKQAPVRLRFPAKRMFPNLLPWSHIASHLLGDCYQVYYEKRRDGTYPFTTYKIGRELYHLYEEVEDWIKAGSPSATQGWTWSKNPIPAFLFINPEDAARLTAKETTNAQ